MVGSEPWRWWNRSTQVFASDSHERWRDTVATAAVKKITFSSRVIWVRYDARGIAAMGPTESAVSMATVHNDGAVIPKYHKPW